MKYAYYPGCSLQSVAKEYNFSMLSLFKSLKIELIEIPDWICCGSTPAHTTSPLLSLALAIANCTWAETQKLDIVAPCASCFSRLKIANLEIKKEKELHKKVNQILNEEYSGNPKILNPLNIFNRIDILARLRNSIKRDLSALKVACYYGCLLSRPKEISEEDNCEAPKKMDRILSTIGLSVCNWQCKTVCCGAGLSITQPNVAFRLVCEILTCAYENGANIIAVACPLCQSNLEMRQQKVSKYLGYELNIPVIYFTQLIGLAIGLKFDELGIEQLIVSPLSLLEEKCSINLSNI